MLHKSLLLVCAVITVVAAAGCGWTEEPYHEIRIRNDYDRTIVKLTVGSTTFRDVSPGETTEYHEIPEGRHEFRGELSGATAIEGSWSFTGRGRHQWTAVLGASGAFSFYED